MTPQEIIDRNQTKITIPKGEMSALDASIGNWWDRSRGKRNNQACPLCLYYRKQVAIPGRPLKPSCTDCVIMRSTGKPYCNEISWREWEYREERSRLNSALVVLNQLRAIKSICTTEDS